MENNNEKIEKMINRVKNLIDLSKKNNSDEEAQSAFLAAQKLMIKYHISAESIQSKDEDDEKVSDNDVTALKKLFWWEKILGTIVAKNFRVKCYTHSVHINGRCKSKVVFMGLDDDLKVAKSIYVLAYEAIKHYAKKYINSWYKENDKARNRRMTEYLKTSYTQGFLSGLKAKFKEQFDELQQEYGLMVMTPKKVEKAFEDLHAGYRRVRVASHVDAGAYNQGKHDGNKIDYQRKTVNATY